MRQIACVSIKDPIFVKDVESKNLVERSQSDFSSLECSRGLTFFSRGPCGRFALIYYVIYPNKLDIFCVESYRNLSDCIDTPFIENLKYLR